MRNKPEAGQLYKHFKGNLYQIVTVAIHTETEEELVVYQALYGDYKIYARPLEMFMSEVDREKYPEVGQKYRFEMIPTIAQGKSDYMVVSENATEETPKLDEGLLEFLDADTYEARFRIFTGMQHRLTDAMIDTMAVCMDTEVPEGKLDERIRSLKNFLQMQLKFECNRF